MIGVRHGGDGIHRSADGRPVLTVSGHIVLGALAEHIGRDIRARIMQPRGSVLQKALHRLCLALPVCIAEVDGTVLLIAPCAVGETAVVKLDLVEAHQLHGLQRQIHLILPHGAVIHAGPVHAAYLQRVTGGIGDHTFGMVHRQIGVIKGGDAADHIVAGLFQRGNALPVFLRRQVGAVIGAGRKRLHHRRGVADGAAVHNVHHKGIDAAVIGNGHIAGRISDGFHIQIQRLYLVGHHIVLKFRLVAGEVIQLRRVTAAVAVTPGGMQLQQLFIIGGHGGILVQTHIGRGNIAALHLIARYTAVCLQAVIAHHRQRLSSFRQCGRDNPVLIQQVHRALDIDLRRGDHPGNVLHHILPGQVAEALILPQNTEASVLARLLHHESDGAAAHQLSHLAAVLVVQHRRFRRRGHKAVFKGERLLMMHDDADHQRDYDHRTGDHGNEPPRLLFCPFLYSRHKQNPSFPNIRLLLYEIFRQNATGFLHFAAVNSFLYYVNAHTLCGRRIMVIIHFLVVFLQKLLFFGGQCANGCAILIMNHYVNQLRLGR